MKALIDGDIVKIACGFSVEHTFYRVYKDENSQDMLEEFERKRDYDAWVAEDESREALYLSTEFYIEPVEHALANVDSMIRNIVQKTGAREAVLFLSGADNYRENVATILPYKGNRKDGARPEYEHLLHNYMVERYGATVSQGCEADDLMSMMQWEHIQAPVYTEETCICTIDKDLDMVPGKHYNWKRDELYEVTEEEGMRNFYLQVLTGDQVDNIQGIPGIGPKRAEKILELCETVGDMYCACVHAYSEAFPEQDPLAIMEENARLLWMSKNELNDWRPWNETGIV